VRCSGYAWQQTEAAIHRLWFLQARVLPGRKPVVDSAPFPVDLQVSERLPSPAAAAASPPRATVEEKDPHPSIAKRGEAIVETPVPADKPNYLILARNAFNAATGAAP